MEDDKKQHHQSKAGTKADKKKVKRQKKSGQITQIQKNPKVISALI